MTNKELVLKFYDEVFNNWDISNLDNYMKDNYIQHNPTAPNGKEGFVEFTKFFFSLKPHMDIIHIGEDGDIVYVFFKCTLENGAINKVCDIYRIEDGKLAEHWDVVEHNVPVSYTHLAPLIAASIFSIFSPYPAPEAHPFPFGFSCIPRYST